MENASKALIIAGGLLVTILVISVCMYMYTSFKVGYAESMKIHTTQQIHSFNMFFIEYPSVVTGYEAYNIIGKVKEVNANDDAVTSISYSGIDRDTEFYFTENFKNQYSYTYKFDGDGFVSSVSIKRVE